IGFTEHLHQNARKPIAESEYAGCAAGMREGLKAMSSNPHREEKHRALKQRLIELAWMARQSGRVAREDHRPWHVGRPPVEFAIDEIGETSQTKPDRRCGGAKVEQPVESGA